MSLRDDILMAAASTSLMMEPQFSMLANNEDDREILVEEMQVQTAGLMKVLMKEGLATGYENVSDLLRPYRAKMANLTLNQFRVAPIYYTLCAEISAYSSASDAGFLIAYRVHRAVLEIMNNCAFWAYEYEWNDLLNEWFPDYVPKVCDGGDEREARYERVRRIM